MSKPEDIPADVWAAALVPLHAIEHLDLATHEWIDLHEAIARLIIAAKAEEREACALLMNDIGAQEEKHCGLTREVQNYYRMRNAIRRRGDVNTTHKHNSEA